ncbi:hypothetical protein Pgy4_37631, partial [Pseudomonas savastanoi pv. glycinea str. race 4]
MLEINRDTASRVFKDIQMLMDLAAMYSPQNRRLFK